MSEKADARKRGKPCRGAHALLDKVAPAHFWLYGFF
jgi:hypothetical protein